MRRVKMGYWLFDWVGKAPFRALSARVTASWMLLELARVSQDETPGRGQCDGSVAEHSHRDRLDLQKT